MRKHALLWGSVGMPSPPSKILHIFSIQKALSFYSASSFFRTRVDSFACGANLKLRQANAIGHKQKLLGHVPRCAGLGYATVFVCAYREYS